MKIIGLMPLSGNGGISSWTRVFRQSFPDDKHEFVFIDEAPYKKTRTGDKENIFYRGYSGLSVLFRILKQLKRHLKTQHYDLLHTTTSGSIGSLRDFLVAKICHQYDVKVILHCRYGCIVEDLQSHNLIGFLLRKVFREMDQIWVLDSHSFNTLRQNKDLCDKVFLTPNCITIKESCDENPKAYNRVAFVGNLVPDKGLYELIEACVLTNVRLDVIGPGTEEIVEHIKKIAGRKIGESIFLHGRVPNPIAVELMHQTDIVALPTYYRQEAFPISILEAMSLTKLVISCPRAAVRDMLTGMDGKDCGILVKPKSVKSIVNAIMWCQTHKKDADQMCKRAYEKVYKCYRTEVVYNLYRTNYSKLIEGH